MKRIFILILTLSVLFAGCASDAPESSMTEEERILGITREDNTGSQEEVIQITEKMFTEQINFIYYNPDEYLGRTISYEGIFDYLPDYTGKELPCVFRYGPGCCANDGNVGFEIFVSGGDYPEPNDWVSVTGTLEYVIHSGMQFLRLRLSDIEVMDERGAESVA